MRSDILHRNRLEFLGELAASLAHELNQPLNVIRMASENLQGHLSSEDEYAHAKLARILAQVDRTSRIVASMGVFSKSGLPQSERFSLQDVMDQVEDLIAGPLSAGNIEYRMEAEDALPYLEGDSVLLEQMLVNLIMNARDAIEERRRRVGEDTDPATDSITVSIPRWQDDQEVMIKVQDTGIGVGGNDIDVLTQPFYTTKGENGGTGLGLAVCKKIAKNIGARISCRDRETGGAEFTLTLPLPPQRADGSLARQNQTDTI